MRAKIDPRAWLEMHQCYGDLADKPTLAVAFACWLRLFWAEGVEVAMNAYIAGKDAVP
ncbi:hypothetical protein [uncultured Roseibium sp.]|uniref:hypothetical protein n=1 Tax=uncultured Roseibium sp. TaxID=1936171 RepID=UPI00261FC373|nr:hypothetical protein [uncultured Roseibium sp.]